MSLKFFKMNILLQELQNGKKKETTTETKVEDGDVSGQAETDGSEAGIDDAMEKVVKRKKIVRKK
jgi:hypothetical protein